MYSGGVLSPGASFLISGRGNWYCAPLDFDLGRCFCNKGKGWGWGGRRTGGT